ncbi:MAG: NUDIX domain-containing protein [Gemmatimonadetes bacterium]|nr:NUDIX domain-containing protein [Gemmatimonadota bacterium]
MSAPVTPRPAATIVLLRDGAGGLEVLLLRRNLQAVFAPGAFVFPGGLVDAEDSTGDVLDLVDGLTVDGAAARLGLVGGHPPALAYWVAAVREAFEETGILLGAETTRDPSDSRRDLPGTDPGRDARNLRSDLLDGRATFAEVLARLEGRIDAGGIAYFAHWITPERSPRRYDTRFFAARVGHDAPAVVDEREVTEARWITPADALLAHASGALSMMLPTVRTLERLAAFSDTRAALAALADAPVPTILPGPDVGGFAGSVPQARLPTS